MLATQNPSGSAGTQLLPESQLDRFTVKLSMGYPTVSEEAAILKSRAVSSKAAAVVPVMTIDDLISLRRAAEEIYVSDEIYDYVARLAQAGRNDKRLELGVSPRGSIAVAAMAKCSAMFNGRDFVVPDDVVFVYTDVCAHRVVPVKNKGRLPSDSEVREIISDITRHVAAPKL